MCRRHGFSSRHRKLPNQGNVSFDNAFYSSRSSDEPRDGHPSSNDEGSKAQGDLSSELNSGMEKDIVSAMNKRRKSSGMRGRRGQALAEFVVCLVGLMFMFLGLMLIGALGAKNVEAFMQSRTAADRDVNSALASTDGKYILEWRDGADGLRYTADDEARILAWSGTLDTFREQISTPDPATSIVPSANNEFQGIDGSGFGYLHIAQAAEMTKGVGQTSVDLEDLGLENAVKKLLFPGIGSTIYLRDETFMPALSLRGSDEGQ